MIKQTVQAERRLIKSPGAKNGGATMRSITVAATLILLLTAHANSQNLNMLGGTSRPVTQEEVAKKKAAEEAYKAAVGKNTRQKIRG
jgi:predicted metalloprotease